MGPLLTVIRVGILGIVALLVAISDRSLSISGLLTLVLPAFAFVYVLLTLSRVTEATR